MKLNIKGVRIKETDNWIIPEKLAPYIGDIYGLYVYDSDKLVHCCSLQGSIELNFIKSTFTYKNEDMNISDEILEKIDDFLMEGDRETPLVSYMNPIHVPEGVDLPIEIPDNEVGDFDIEEYGYELMNTGEEFEIKT